MTFGDGTGPPIAARLTHRSTELAVLAEPELKLGEAYMDGTLVMEQGSIADLLELAMEAMRAHALRGTNPLDAVRAAQRRPPLRSR